MTWLINVFQPIFAKIEEKDREKSKEFLHSLFTTFAEMNEDFNLTKIRNRTELNDDEKGEIPFGQRRIYFQFYLGFLQNIFKIFGPQEQVLFSEFVKISFPLALLYIKFDVDTLPLWNSDLLTTYGRINLPYIDRILYFPNSLKNIKQINLLEREMFKRLDYVMTINYKYCKEILSASLSTSNYLDIPMIFVEEVQRLLMSDINEKIADVGNKMVEKAKPLIASNPRSSHLYSTIAIRQLAFLKKQASLTLNSATSNFSPEMEARFKLPKLDSINKMQLYFFSNSLEAQNFLGKKKQIQDKDDNSAIVSDLEHSELFKTEIKKLIIDHQKISTIKQLKAIFFVKIDAKKILLEELIKLIDKTPVENLLQSINAWEHQVFFTHAMLNCKNATIIDHHRSIFLNETSKLMPTATRQLLTVIKDRIKDYLLTSRSRESGFSYQKS